ncbi:sensor histidine kinase [Noviherbaspirillum pedocola]|uniref:histidine kinase n=1 Tax=Noviherbaspirillum pedocola TaxID=2801341 RepID=A0A934W372_9BURK|nr:sensor histidine kinase [Noviherbaspirillum pedocola]MBK4737126.1 sensor histidine kinase N-terminal domain-containing protein [Noviherbaspirillum pedocola]
MFFSKTPEPAQRALGSLRGQLLRWLLIPLTVLVVINSVSAYRNALDAADLAYDRSLLASARALAERVTVANGHVVVDVPYVALDSFETDALGRLYYKVSGIHGEFVSGYEDLPPVPKDLKRSDIYPALVRFYHANYRGTPVRIAALLDPVYDDSMRGIALIQVGESLEARRELSRRILIDTVWRQAALVAAAAVLAWIAVRFVLRPLMRLTDEVAHRAPTDLSGFDANGVHRELRPMVAAMNDYMGRLDALIAGQRRFIADASHQLRTPLTVLKTQAELALRANDAAAMRDIVEGIARTTDSTVHLANRLLTLARADHGLAEGEMGPVSLSEITRSVALELAPQALAGKLDLSLEADTEVGMRGNALLLHEMAANLLDNAIRYTPPLGKVAVRVASREGVALLEIEDSGCGIAQADRERVFEPFYRAPGAQQRNGGGAGLGLAIVRDIVELHHGAIRLDDGAYGGLKVTLRFPV